MDYDRAPNNISASSSSDGGSITEQLSLNQNTNKEIENSVKRSREASTSSQPMVKSSTIYLTVLL